jgi:predicted nucleic acid-binding protein
VIVVDTDVMVDVLREHPPAIAWLASLGDEEIILPGFVFMELLQGCRNRREHRTLEERLTGFQVAWPEPHQSDEALRVFARLHLRHRIGIIDALSGQLAVSLNLPLHKFNQRHYVAIPHLQTVQPY